ncbi:NAD(P)-dependent alcohol dehydrogenase [Taibaiella chishuiensis]|uniref:Putative zinc-type alcohol dehydrogenase-like protein n=1 Tax=Taibaiella chishuiensis TaxID=1434707 RepID=A0A2P8DCZ3_9BACT|nr:NAD(P)-dependent alcohol dehydrogenase [Taibaiella chishuiensis]PSK95094.1 putative zinc-type alcohol dehydrogenase-like protein [Taibaiella chishuiensis]
MLATKGYAAHSATDALHDFEFERRDCGPRDVQFEILYCGVCHSDLHQVRNEWGGTVYPIVPGHEIVGRVTQVGDQVTKFKVGDLAGVGCLVDSCGDCENCKKDLEQFCKNGSTGTYNSKDKVSGGVTYGGYSNQIVVDEGFVLRVSDKLALEAVAPLLCAGITTYSPLRHWKVGKGHKVAVVGLGGLGHMAVKFAASFGAEVTMLSTSPAKEQDARKLGAHKFALTRDPEQLKELANYFDFIIDTVSAPHDYNQYLSMLNTDGVMICVGVPPTPTEIMGFNLIGNRRSIAGSLIGGIAETQEMLDYCAEHNIVSDIEVIKMSEINEAYERMLKGDVKYRFVIDMATL